MEEKLKQLEILKNRSLRDANAFHKKGDNRMEEICTARADAYKCAIEVINGKNLQLEKVDNKEMSITVRIGTHIADAEDIFEIESGGINYICIDSKE